MVDGKVGRCCIESRIQTGSLVLHVLLLLLMHVLVLLLLLHVLLLLLLLLLEKHFVLLLLEQLGRKRLGLLVLAVEL